VTGADGVLWPAGMVTGREPHRSPLGGGLPHVQEPPMAAKHVAHRSIPDYRPAAGASAKVGWSAALAGFGSLALIFSPATAARGL
jgi:hypothetical protein